MAKKRTVKPAAGQIITVGKDGPPRLLVQSQTTGELDAYEFNGRIASRQLLGSGFLYDGYYLFAAHSLEDYFKKQMEIPK